MSQFYASWDTMKSCGAKLNFDARKLMYYDVSISSIADDLPFSDNISHQIKKALNKCGSQLRMSGLKVARMGDTLETIANTYKTVECGRLFCGSNFIGKIVPGILTVLSGLTNLGALNGSASGSIKNIISNFSSKSGVEYDENGNISYIGAEIEGSYTAALASGTAGFTYGLLSGEVSGSVGEFSAKGSAEALIYKDGKLRPNISAEFSTGFTGVKASGSLKVGDENVSATGKLSGSLFSANAEAKGSLGVITTTDENGNSHTTIGAQGKIGGEVYAAQGSASGTIDIFGIKITGTATGKAGGAGASASGSVTTGGVSGEVNVGFIVGGGARVDVDWSGFDPSKAVDAAEKVIDDAGKAFNSAKDAVSNVVNKWNL